MAIPSWIALMSLEGKPSAELDCSATNGYTADCGRTGCEYATAAGPAGGKTAIRRSEARVVDDVGRIRPNLELSGLPDVEDLAQ